jgi:MOSC domain-containing protein YiiM
MRVASVQISNGPRTVPYRGKTIATGIFKEPVAGPVPIRRMGLDGDLQVDRRYHGGTNKAVYSYALEHAEFWQATWQRDIPPGLFGENLTTTGLLETDVRIGDRFRVGGAILEAVQPRQPCFKLGLKLRSTKAIADFRTAGRPGIYWTVIDEGIVEAGSPITLISRPDHAITIHDLWRIVTHDQPDPAIAETLLTKHSLDAEWREPLEAMVSA